MNAKEEFIKHIGEIGGLGEWRRSVLCARITFNEGDDSFDNDLTTGWDKEDWSLFLKSIDHVYDNGYGGQNLFGRIWYSDGTWSEREEYDGSEWWEHNYCPSIPAELDRKDKVREQKLNQIL